MAEALTTTVSRQWLFKSLAFTVVLLGFGIWALFDAAVLYPRRGAAHSSYQFKEWLEAADQAGRLNAPAFTVETPKAALEELEARERDIRARASQDGPASADAKVDAAKLDWLRSLVNAWKLTPDPKYLGETADKRPLYFDPRAGAGFALGPAREHAPVPLETLRQELVTKWNTSNRATALNSYDLLVQWIFVACGFGGGLWLVFIILRSYAAARTYSWEPEAQRLGLPGGAALVPADLAEIDKRQWHKYYATLVSKDGRRFRLDLLRFAPLEQWVLAMERAAFPEAAAAEAAAESAPPQPENQPAPNPNM